MRPCNQCRRPVENDVFLCEQCAKYNEEHGVEAPKTMRAFMGDVEPPPVDPNLDGSVTQLATFFYCVVGLLFGLLGFALFGIQGLVIGGLVGTFLGMGLLRMLIM